MNDTQQLNRWLQALQAKSEVQLAHVEAEIKRAALQASTELIQELQLHQIELEMQNEELRRMQVALETSRAKYQELYEFAPVGYLTLNAEGVIVEINLTGVGLLGVERIQLIGKRFEKHIGDSHKDFWYRHFLHAKQSRQPFGCELPVHLGNGVDKILHIDCLYTEDEGANPLLWLTLTDVSEFKRLETERRFANVAFQTQDGIIITDEHRLIQRVNRAFTRITGYSAEESVGKKANFLRCKRLGARFYDTVWAKVVQDGYWQGEIWACNKNGVERLYHLSTTSVTNSEGFVTHYVSIFRDITEQKQIEKDLCVAAIAFEAQEGIIIADANKTIISANKSFCRSTGYDEAEIIGNPLFFLHSSLHDEQFFAELWATVARQGYWRGELWKKRKNNQLFPVFQTVSAIAFDGGAVSFYVSSFTDITVQKQAEKILQETQARLASQVATTQEELDKIRHETEEVNTALSVLLRHKEISVLESQNQLTRQLEATVLPFLKQLQGLVAGQQQSSQLADIIEANLYQMLASYGRPGNLAAAYFKLTPVEAQVASMIRQGLPTKVIATTLNNSPGTISNHRKSIRKKLGFGKNTGNLQAYLLSLSE